MDFAFAFAEQTTVDAEKSYCSTATDETCTSSRHTVAIPMVKWLDSQTFSKTTSKQ